MITQHLSVRDVVQIDKYDIVVIGGGIQGVGVAQAAAAHGYTVLLLEQTDFAAATSSRSSKLIHGGLRYLETAQFSLVRECLRERSILLKVAPDLVKLVPFFIPVYKQTSRRPGIIRLGLSLYALLGGLKKSHRFHKIPKTKWRNPDGLDTNHLQAVFQYYDGQTDDVALTRAVARSAMNMGAAISMPAQFVSAHIENNNCSVLYRHNDKEVTCDTKAVVNAAGPWVNQVLNKFIPAPRCLPVDMVQGTHILLRDKITGGIYYVEAPQDQRAVFVMPWKDQTLVGTTETIYSGSPDLVKPLETEIDYLYNTAAHYFPRYRERKNDFYKNAFAGLRILPSDSSPVFHRTRDTILHTNQTDHPRVVSIYGGKLTAYRATAEKVIKQLQPALPARKAIATTRTLRLEPV